MSFQPAAKTDDLWEGEILAIVIAGVPVLLTRWQDRVLAFEDRCAHRGLRVSGGQLAGHVLTCPGHEWTYDIRSGHGVNPTTVRLKSFPTRLDAGVVFIDVDGGEDRDSDG